MKTESALTTVESQTNFLLKAQRGLLAESLGYLEDFAQTLEHYDSSGLSAGEKENFASIVTLFREKTASLQEEFEGDIAYLEDQLKVIAQVRSVGDPVKQAEFEEMLLKDIGELESNDDFEKRIESDINQSRSDLLIVLSELRDILADGGISELQTAIEGIDAGDFSDEDCACGDEECEDDCDDDTCCDDDDCQGLECEEESDASNHDG